MSVTSDHLAVWRVRYDTRFSSSSGGQPYHSDHRDCTGLVVTAGESLDDVRRALRSMLGNQTMLTDLHEAHYLGSTLNRIGSYGEVPA